MELAKLKAKREGHRRVIENFLKKIENAKRNSAILEFQVILEAITAKVNILNSLNEEIQEKTEADDIVSEIEESEEYSLTLDINLRHLRAFKDHLVDQRTTDDTQLFTKSSDIPPACSETPGKKSSSKLIQSHSLPKVEQETTDRDVPLTAQGTANEDALSEIGQEINDLEPEHGFERRDVPLTASVTENEESKPGKPRQFGKPNVDIIRITWDEPNVPLDPPVFYEVRYKKVVEDKWILHKEHLSNNVLILDNLPSGADFVFKVRMINDDEVGPYSLESDEIGTAKSADNKLSGLVSVPKDNVTIAVKRLPFTEDKLFRNETAKTRKLIYGHENKCQVNERIIMMVGVKSAGKSTLIDAMINYIFGIKWRDSFRLTVENLEAEEIGNKENKTKWITCYKIHPTEGTRIPYTLTIIDTPGYGDGDVKEIDADLAISERIRQLFSADDEKGIHYLDAVCVVIKASDVRVTQTQKDMFNFIPSLFKNDANNICIMMTFADGSLPLALLALKAINLPHEEYFSFNNSALFVNNAENPSNVSRAMLDWTSGQKSFEQFFEALEKLNMKPGKPRQDGKPEFDVIRIKWTVPKVQIDPPISYEVRYKNIAENKWVLHKKHLSENVLKLENLPSGAKFVFKVRMINDEEVGPYSHESDEIGTAKSAANRMISGLVSVPKYNSTVAVKQLPFTEDKLCRDEIAKIRKLIHGKASRSQVNETIILMVGQTGAGKSTLIDAMINYIFGVSWRDSFRLTVENLEAENVEIRENQTMSPTKWIRCYTIHPTEGTRIPYILTIIDTPGYGSSRDVNADRAFSKQIRQLLQNDKKGVPYLNAVCFVIKASDTRLTPTQQCQFNYIRSLFQNYIDNLITMVTFADGNPPGALSVLKALQLPHTEYFSFNNSDLFANNTENSSTVNRAMLDWDMGRKSFEQFFKALEKLNMTPGKPRPDGQPAVDIIKIKWTEPKVQIMPISYEVSYKKVTEDKWILHNERLSENFLKLENLPSGVKFVFRVRMINGPDSLTSDEIGTVESAAKRMAGTLVSVRNDNIDIEVKRLSFTENKLCRNEIAKTRTLVHGREGKCQVNEKTIMMVGQTGAGKSTLIDAMINYIFGVSWIDPLRLTVEHLEAEELENKGNQAMSQTKWITCYTIHQKEGIRIPYTLTIIDTPGYADVGGIKADQDITKQIQQLFEAKGDNKILHLDAVCFVVKASDVRLTQTQEYVFNSIVSLFRKDIDKFCIMITFADGNPPGALSALKAAKLPHTEYFSFNNSALFASNDADKPSIVTRAMLDWDMGRKSFEHFFEALEKLDMKPGKPQPDGKPGVDFIRIKWTEPKVLIGPSFSYEVRYRNVTEDKWIRHEQHLSKTLLKLENLPSGYKFIFQVRMITDEKVGPYSLASDEIGTVISAANQLFSGLLSVPIDYNKVAMKRLPFTEDTLCRNEIAKTRKLTYGHESEGQVNEKIIMVLGQTGSGKSTLIDAMINYIFGVSWRDSFRLTVENLEAEELENKGNQAMSQTMWITCYTIHPKEGIRIPYTLTIIDTPGYGDVRGIKADQAITEQIRQLFEAKEKKGILYLNAVCFVIKSSDARLTTSQKYIFNSVLSIFQKDIIDNFCMMLTFADGNPPVALSALRADNLPHKEYYSFNNSTLFANNTENSFNVSRSLIDWDMGQQSFKKFFEALEKFDSKSLALSQEVLAERRRLEITVENMQDKLSATLQMHDSFEKQIKLLKDCTETIEKNKDFTFTVKETSLRREYSSTYNLNCVTCESTCHRDCSSWNVGIFSIFKRFCDAFSGGQCMQCARKCNVKCHINEKYEYNYRTEEVTRIYSDIKQKYEAAAKEKISHESLIHKMEIQLEAHSREIEDIIKIISKSKERLKQIALRNDPFSVADHYDVWIKEEETNGRDGWQERVQELKKDKKQAQLKADYEKVGKDVQAKIKETATSAKRLLNS